MTVLPVEDAASARPDDLQPQTDEGSGTGPQPDVVRPRLARPGLFIAGIVLSAALGGSAGTPTSTDLWFRRREDACAESSTEEAEVSPLLIAEIQELFEQGAHEFFHDGVESNFSRALMRTLTHHGKEAFRAISEYLFSGGPRPAVVSEALRWLADFNDASTLSQRWAILQRTLKASSPQVRDGAILGFAALDDPRACSLLLEARNLEQIGELRVLIDQVVAHLRRNG